MLCYLYVCQQPHRQTIGPVQMREQDMAGSQDVANARLHYQDCQGLACQSFEYDEEEEHEIEVTNVVTMVCFATALMENLARINRGELVTIEDIKSQLRIEIYCRWQSIDLYGNKPVCLSAFSTSGN